MRVLTSISCSKSKTWRENTTMICPDCSDLMYAPNVPYVRRQALSLFIAVKFMVIRHRYDVVVVTGGLVGNYISWLQALVPFGKIPTIMTDCLWAVQANPLKQNIKAALHRLSSRSVDKFVIWARHEISDFSKLFGIQEKKFTFIPFHTTINEFRFDIRDDGFVFAGGNSDRDYKTLIEAVRGLEIPVFIAASDPRLFAGVRIPANVTVASVSDVQFREKMASSRLTVVPIRKGLLRSPGQQTILNAMAMGKPTIVVGPREAEDYVEDGETGIIVDYEDVQALRDAVCKLFFDDGLRRRMSAKCAGYASVMDDEKCFRAIYDLAVASVAEARRRNRNGEGSAGSRPEPAETT